MEPVILITKADFASYVEVSSNIDTIKLNTQIKHAQEFDLRPLLGDLLYYDMLKNLTVEKYQELLKGKEYQVETVDIAFEGIAPVLVHYATARLVRNGNSIITATGLKEKLNEFSNPADPKEISRLANNYESIALGYWLKTKTFLDKFASSYPYWNRMNCEAPSGMPRKSGARIYGLRGR